MNNLNVKAAFEKLTEELDAIIPELNKKISELMAEQAYDEASEIVNKAKLLQTFRQKVVGLKDEWIGFESTLPISHYSGPGATNSSEKVFTDERVTERITPFSIIKPNVGNSGKYNLGYYINGKSQEIKDMYRELSSKIRLISPNIYEKYNQLYISFKKGNVIFVQIHFQQSRLKIWIKPHISKLRDPNHLARDVSDIGHYGTGLTEIDFDYPDQIDDVLDLILQSYKLA